jgi:hypothetical protein
LETKLDGLFYPSRFGNLENAHFIGISGYIEGHAEAGSISSEAQYAGNAPD